MATIYEELGVDTIINAAGTYTIIGGSRMSEGTLSKMKEAAHYHVEIRKLQKAVHERIAELTKNEADFVCNGAACGLYISAVSAIAKHLKKDPIYLTTEEIANTEIIVFASHHNPYNYGLKQLGVNVKIIGYPNIILPLSKADLENAITEKTVAIIFAFSNPGGWIAPGGLDFDSTIEVASKFSVPVIVDAAAQIPPLSNMWRFTSNGATAIIFSGGKDLKGPQAAGLILGKKDFLDVVVKAGFPNYGFGRMLKTGREEIVGMYWAVKEAIELGDEKRVAQADEQIAHIKEVVENNTSFSVERGYPNEAGQPFPRANIKLNGKLDASKMLELMMQGSPKVMCNNDFPDQIWVNPMTLHDDEIDIVIDKIIEVYKSL